MLVEGRERFGRSESRGRDRGEFSMAVLLPGCARHAARALVENDPLASTIVTNVPVCITRRRAIRVGLTVRDIDL